MDCSATVCGIGGFEFHGEEYFHHRDAQLETRSAVVWAKNVSFSRCFGLGCLAVKLKDAMHFFDSIWVLLGVVMG